MHVRVKSKITLLTFLENKVQQIQIFEFLIFDIMNYFLKSQQQTIDLNHSKNYRI